MSSPSVGVDADGWYVFDILVADSQGSVMARPNWFTIASVLLTTGLVASIPALGGAQTIDLFDGEGSAPASDTGVADDSPDTDAGTGVTIERGSASGASGDRRVPGRAAGHIELEFERRGSSILVPAELSGVDVYFVLDTGASLVSLSPAVAEQAGISPAENAPTVPVQTASGPAGAEMGIVDRLRLGRRLHRDVTYFTCGGCGGGRYRGKPVAGLLGLNVLRRYDTDIDAEQGVVTLTKNSSFDDRLHDVEPWIRVHDTHTIPLGDGPESAEVHFRATNRAPRRIDEADFEIGCRNGPSVATVESQLDAGESIKIKERVDSLTCSRPTVELVAADW